MRCFLLLVVILVLGCSATPVPVAVEQLSLATSEFNIGTRLYVWTDSSRIDTYYGGRRVINVQVWYPVDTDISTDELVKAPYYYRIKEAYQSLANWSEEDLEEVGNIPTQSWMNAPIKVAASGYPVLLFSPSLGMNMSVYTYYAEQLTKRGYVVVGVNHLHESEYVFDETGSVIPANVQFHDSLKTLDIPQEITAEEYRRVKGVRQKVLGEDLLFCLDRLSALNTTEFSESLDLNAVGVWGHSIGGAAAVYAAYLDERIKAVLDLDGTPPSVALEEGISPPFLFIEDLTDYQNHQGYAKMHQRRSDFCDKARSDAYRILLGNTNHNSFLDINYHLASSVEEKARALEVIEQTHSYMQGFFDHYLQGMPIDIKPTTTEQLEILVF